MKALETESGEKRDGPIVSPSVSIVQLPVFFYEHAVQMRFSSKADGISVEPKRDVSRDKSEKLTGRLFQAIRFSIQNESASLSSRLGCCSQD